MRAVAVALLLAQAACVAATRRSTADLDARYLTGGPVGGAIHVEGAWVSGVGLEASFVDIHEHAFPAAIGAAAGGVAYAGRDGGRLWLEAEVAVKRPLPVAVGLGAGPAVEVDAVRPPRWGGEATLWVFAGVVPYVRAGWLQETGTFGELGLMIKLPVARF